MTDAIVESIAQEIGAANAIARARILDSSVPFNPAKLALASIPEAAIDAARLAMATALANGDDGIPECIHAAVNAWPPVVKSNGADNERGHLIAHYTKAVDALARARALANSVQFILSNIDDERTRPLLSLIFSGIGDELTETEGFLALANRDQAEQRNGLDLL